jgi:chromosome segregation ATPase
MQDSASTKIRSLEKALEAAGKEIVQLSAKVALQQAKLKACGHECNDLRKTVTVLNAQLELQLSKPNGRHVDFGQPRGKAGIRV